MRKIKVVTDSTCDLSKSIIETNDIAVVPLYVSFDKEIFKDGVEISTDKLYEKIEEYDMLPKTSAPSPADFRAVFDKYINEGMDIIYIGLSSKMSSTIQNAKIAASEYPSSRIEVVDSQNLSTGIGLLVMKACDYVNEGMELIELAGKISALVPKVKTAFVVDTLEFLHKGGRCTAVETFVGGLLKIKPIVKVVDGSMILGEKARGKMEKAFNMMLEDVLDDNNTIDSTRVFVTHSKGQEAAEHLKADIEKQLPQIKEIIITEAGCVISSHCGKNTCGILYLTK